jgi:hypothetical protein
VDRLRFHLTNVLDSNIDHDLEDIDSYGIVSGVEARLVTHARPPLVWLAYEGGYQSFTNSSRWDRWEQSVELGTRIPVAGHLSLEGGVNYDNRISTEDRELVNQFTATPGLRLDGARWGLRGFGFGACVDSRKLRPTENIWMATERPRESGRA